MSKAPEYQGRAKAPEDGGKLGREVLGLLSIFLGLLVILSLATFDGRDPWLNHVVSGAAQVRNRAGLFGAYLAGLLYDIVGAGAWSVPAFFCLAGIRRILGAVSWPWWRWAGFALLGLALCLAGAAIDLGHVALMARDELPVDFGNISSHGGGIIGHIIYTWLVGWMGPVGAFLVWFFSLALALQMLTGISLTEVIMGLAVSGKEHALRKLEEWSRRKKERAGSTVFDIQPLPPAPHDAAPQDAWYNDVVQPNASQADALQAAPLQPYASQADAQQAGASQAGAPLFVAGPQSVQPLDSGFSFEATPPVAPSVAPSAEEAPLFGAAASNPELRPQSLALGGENDFQTQAEDARTKSMTPLWHSVSGVDEAFVPGDPAFGAAASGRLAADAPGRDDLVHPLVPRPQLPENELLPPELFSPDLALAETPLLRTPDHEGLSFEAPDAVAAPASGPTPAPKLGPKLGPTSGQAPRDEDELPPWVRDFEMDRLGVQGAKGAKENAAPGLMQDSAAAGPQPFTLPPLVRERAVADLPASFDSGGSAHDSLPQKSASHAAITHTGSAPLQAGQLVAPEKAAPSSGNAVTSALLADTPVPDNDDDLLNAIWGPEADASCVRSMAPGATPVSAPESAPERSFAPNVPSAAGTPNVAGKPPETPLLSAQTAAAVEALRAAAHTPPDAALRPGPDALTLDSDTPLPFTASAQAAPPQNDSLPSRSLSAPGSEHEATFAAAQDVRAGMQPLAWSNTASHTGPETAAPTAAHADAPDKRQDTPYHDAESPVSGPSWAAEAFEEDDITIFEAPPIEKAQGPGIVERLVQAVAKPRVIALPSLELLQSTSSPTGGTPREVLEEKGRSLMTCLKDFGIQGELVGITPGPVVTMFEVRPAPGVRVSRIANLSDDLALALKAVAVRIQAPVPGTDTVGIEIPNQVRETVCLKELLGSQVFAQSKSLLTLALGKDIAGNPAVADLATMPHLLVAGATGAGKSVGINSIILSLLYKARPDEVQLLLVDPKRVEMAIYADLPHLVHPVVTEMQLAKNALEWAVAEMERRYDCIARAGVRNIADYNAKIASFGDTPPDNMADLEFIPYLVLVIDELADLMLVAAKEVENSIVRLAQLARAAGIHLILATQRPSVDVVTGLIKANFPCRISFQVTSKHDSRTILDTVGAEHLLGKGDMLFKPAGGKSLRMHGAFVRDSDVNAVVGYWKAQQPPRYRVDFADWNPEIAGGVLSGGTGGALASGDPMYNEAVEFVRQQGKASISLIQRKFRIGFNKAARYVEQMEMDGIIGPADGSKPRVVIG